MMSKKVPLAPAALGFFNTAMTSQMELYRTYIFTQVQSAHLQKSGEKKYILVVRAEHKKCHYDYVNSLTQFGYFSTAYL